jgi:hypothetical protein
MWRPVAVAALATAHVLLVVLLPPAAAQGWSGAAGFAFKAAAAAAALRAAFALGRGDYMRVFWLAIGVSFALLAAADAPALLGAAGEAAARHPARLLLLVLGNALSVYGAARLALACRSAGLGFEASWRLPATWAIFAVIAAAVTGQALRRELPLALAGHPETWADLFSYLCDGASFVLMVPVLRFAIRLGGGRLAGVWWALFGANTSWLLFDATGALALYSSASGMALAAGEGFRALACLLTALAAWHQRDLVASARAARAAAATAPVS